MSLQTIPLDAWAAELDSFSRQHEGWLVSITTRTPDGRIAVEAEDVPLQGVSPASHDAKDISVAVGDAQRHLTHGIHDVVRVHVDLTADRAERALVIDARDGSTTTIEFRSPLRVEEVDGLPGPNRR